MSSDLAIRTTTIDCASQRIKASLLGDSKLDTTLADVGGLDHIAEQLVSGHWAVGVLLASLANLRGCLCP